MPVDRPEIRGIEIPGWGHFVPRSPPAGTGPIQGNTRPNRQRVGLAPVRAGGLRGKAPSPGFQPRDLRLAIGYPRPLLPPAPHRSTHVSLLPPPCELFTTSEPRRSATRVRPPGRTLMSRAPLRM